MGDIIPATVKPKEGGLSSIQCPMLNQSNYTVWAMKMRIALRAHKVWDIIETAPTGELDEEKKEKNIMAMALLVQSIPETLTLQLGELGTAKEVWEAIKTRNVGAERVKEARLQTLMNEFDRLKMKDTEKIDEFAGKLSEIASKSAALGEKIEESKLVKKFLKSLPRKKYIHIVASLEQVLDLKTNGFEDIVGRLKVYEERVLDEEEETQEDQSKLLYANQEHQSSRDFTGERGRGRGGRFGYRGRGRGGRFGGGGRDLSKITCYRCDKLGHFASNCPDRLLKLKEALETENNDTQDADELMMHEIVYLNEKNCRPSEYEIITGDENIWYLDNGASNHMTGDRRYFNKIDDSITGKVRFGDDSRIDIKGKGTISFIDMNGEPRIIKNVYFIPDLKSNIISLGQATESGCDIRMRGGYLTMHDSEGKLLVKAERSRNRLYKIHMRLMNMAASLNLSKISESSRWHARMGHINFDTMKAMIQRDLVNGVSCTEMQKEVCSSCLLGKQTRQKFPQVTSYRATHILELIHGDLCGPITPTLQEK